MKNENRKSNRRDLGTCNVRQLRHHLAVGEVLGVLKGSLLDLLLNTLEDLLQLFSIRWRILKRRVFPAPLTV